jgi:hypothetical protein
MFQAIAPITTISGDGWQDELRLSVLSAALAAATGAPAISFSMSDPPNSPEISAIGRCQHVGFSLARALRLRKIVPFL